MLTGSWYSVDPDTAKLSVMCGDSHVLAVDVFDEFSQVIAVTCSPSTSSTSSRR